MKYAELTNKELVNDAELCEAMDTTLTHWSASSLANRVQKKTAFFGNAVQRSEVWDVERKSLLIHSLIKGYPIPNFYAVKTRDDNDKVVYDFIDGKQRSLAIYEFINNQYALRGIPEIEFEDIDEGVDFNDCKFADLPQSVQKVINDADLSIIQMNDLTDEQTADVFRRLNNGKSLSQVELTRVFSPCLDTIKKLTNEPIFEEACTESQRDKYYDEDTVLKLFKLEYGEGYSLDSKDTREFMKDFNPTDEQTETVRKALSNMKDIHDYILAYTSSSWDKETVKLAKRVAKKVYNRTNLVTFSYYTIKNDTADLADLADFALYFFSGERASAIDRDYNENCRNGANHASRVLQRLNIIDKYFDEFVNSDIRDKFTESTLIEKIA